MWLELMERGDAVIFARPLSLYRRHEGQEGAQADVIVRSRVEWRRLIEEYWHKRMFLTEHEEYQSVLARLREERSRIAPLLPQVPAALRKAYEQETPPFSIILMNRVEECAPVRMDAPLNLLAARGSVSLTGCMSAKDTPLELYDVTSMYDSIILFERANLMPTANVRQMLAEAASHGSIVLQEMDDHPNVNEAAARDHYFLFRAVSAVQTSTKYLADYLRKFNPYVYLFENQLAELPFARSYEGNASQVTIFFGALNRRADWEPLMPSINAAIQEHGDRLYFRVVSDYAFYQQLRTEHKSYVGGTQDGSVVAPYECYVEELHSSDIALLPLNDTEFNRAKSDLKFIEAAGNGAAVLAAPTVYAATVRDGETGLIYHHPKEFAQKLDLLIRRADLRRRLAENAYRYVAEQRLLAGHLDDYILAYRELFGRREELERERLRRVAKCFPNL